jgi:hypothetical protein
MAQPPAPTQERVLLSRMTRTLPSLQEHPTFIQAFGARLLAPLLWIICALVVAFLLAWLITRPTLSQVREILGASAEAKIVLETLRELQRDHFDQFRNLFQLLVLSGLIPLITLFAGYTFGTQEHTRSAAAQDSENAP